MYGLLVLGPTENKQTSNIEIEKWPVLRTVKKTDDQAGGEQYHVLVTGEELEDVIRYGEISLKEIASVKGSQIYSDERRNNKFNGNILFSTNLGDLGLQAEENIREMVSRIEDWANRTGISAGNGKAAIRITLVP